MRCIRCMDDGLQQTRLPYERASPGSGGSHEGNQRKQKCEQHTNDNCNHKESRLAS